MGTAARSAAAALLPPSVRRRRLHTPRSSAARWTGIKAKYRLTVTPPKKQALQELLATCPA
ncbi:hypothetical protein [Streptomyces sp. NPDC055134]